MGSNSIRVCAVAAVFGAALLHASDLSKAEDLYKHTDFDGSLALLEKHSGDHCTNFLVARDYYMLGDFKKAADYLQMAVSQQPGNSEYMDWLGRALGKRAESSNPLMAPGPKNLDALSDMFDYYLEAPGFLGGGFDKALAIAERTAKLDPAQGYFEKAKLAQKRKEFQSAEDQLRQAINLGPHQVGHLLALGRFLANQGRNKESDAVFLEAQAKHPNAPQVLFAWASVLVKQKRDLPQAKTMLEKYMQASLTPDDPPQHEARRLLREVGGA